MTDHPVTLCLEAWRLYDAYTLAITNGGQTKIDAAFQAYADHCETCEKCTVEPRP